MEPWEGKKYKLAKSDNFEEYMKELGVGLMLRKIGGSIYPTVEFKKNNDGTCSFTTTSTFKSSTINFKLGEEFDEETLDGRKVKSVCTLEGDKLVQKQKGDKPTTIERVFTPKELITTLSIGDIKSVRIYKAV